MTHFYPISIQHLLTYARANLGKLTTFFDFPVLTLFFHEFSIWTFPANILVEPLIPLIMIFGLISIVSGLILPFVVAKIFSIPALVLTQVLIWIGNVFGLFQMIAVPTWFSWLTLFLFAGVCLWAFFSNTYEEIIVEFEREMYGVKDE